MKKFFTIFLLTVLCGFFNLTAADDLTSSPWVGWRKGYESYDRAGAFKEDRQFAKALDLYKRSRAYFEAIRRNFPDWNKTVVEGRIKLCDNQIAALQSQSGTQVDTNAPVGKDIMPPVHEVNHPASGSNAAATVPAAGYSYSSGTAAAAGSSASGRLYIEMQSEIEQYRHRLRNALMEIDSLQVRLQQSNARSRDIDGVLQDYRLLQDKYALLEAQYRTALARAASGGNERYEKQITELKLANDEMLKSLREMEKSLAQKDAEYAKSRTEVLKFKDEQQKLSLENRRLLREQELLRNRVTAGNDSSKTRQLEEEIARKDQRIARLNKLLSENAAAGGLQTELQRLQDELDAAVKASAADTELRRRISDLTAVEASLRKQLSEALALLDERGRELQALRKSDVDMQKISADADLEIRRLQGRIQNLEKELKSYADRYSSISRRHSERVEADAINHGVNVAARKEAESALAEAQKKLQERSGEIEKLQSSLKSAEELVKTTRHDLIELKAQRHSNEIELRKMAELQKAYDELKAKFDLFNQASNSDVLSALNRIPGLEESVKRYEQENSSLIAQITELKKSGTAAAAGQTAAVQDAEKIETLLADARSAEARGNLELAVWGYRQVLLRDKNNLEAAARMGRINLQNGKYDEAGKLLAAVVKSKPADQQAVNDLARSFIGKHDYPAALQVIQAFKSKNQVQPSVDLLLTEAVAWSRSGKNADAEKAFKAVLKADPANGEAAYELALSLSADKNRLKEAGEFYMLAKNNGMGVDSYLEDLLRSFSSADNGTRDFLINNIYEAWQSNDSVSASWYLTEAGKLYSGDAAYKLAQGIEYIFKNQFDQTLKIIDDSCGEQGKFIRIWALLKQNKDADAEKILNTLTKPLVPEPLNKVRKFLEKDSAGSSGKTQVLYQALLKKLPQK